MPLIIRDIRVSEKGHLTYSSGTERNFFIRESISDSLELNWIADTEGGFSNSSIVLNDSLVFAGDLAGKIYAFKNSTGKLVGKEKYSGAISTTPILVSMRLFYVVNESDEEYSTLYYYDYTSGKVLDKVEVPGKCDNELIMFDDGIVLLNERGRLIKFNMVGYKEWEIETDELTICSPAAKGDIVVFGNMAGEIIAIDLSTRKVKYRNKICKGFRGGVTISGDDLYIGGLDGNIYSININTGKVNWKYDTGVRIATTPISDDNYVYCGNLDGVIYSIFKSDGKLHWKNETGGIINAAPLVSENYLVQPDVNKKVHFIDVQTGNTDKILHFDRRVKMSPVFYNNTIYFGVDNNEIYSYKVIESNKDE